MNNIVFFCLYLLFNPKLIFYWLRHKLYIPVYLQFGWLKDYSINTFIDVGAHKGQVIKTINYLFPKAKIFAFEPDKESFDFLRKNFQSENILIENLAISQKNGQSSFFHHQKSHLSSLLEPGDNFNQISPNKNKISKLIVKTKTLDTFFKDKKIIGSIFLKIDTQGAEGMVLKGAEQFLEKVDIIHLEIPLVSVYRGDAKFDLIYERLTNKGFTFLGQVHESDFYPFFGLPISANCVFVKTNIIPLRSGAITVTKK